MSKRNIFALVIIAAILLTAAGAYASAKSVQPAPKVVTKTQEKQIPWQILNGTVTAVGSSTFSMRVQGRVLVKTAKGTQSKATSTVYTFKYDKKTIFNKKGKLSSAAEIFKGIKLVVATPKQKASVPLPLNLYAARVNIVATSSAAITKAATTTVNKK